MLRIGVIGFGFSGNVLLANLVRSAQQPLEIYVIDPQLNARGMAYSTPYAAHLLNVRAAFMGAFADDVGGFMRWLGEHHTEYGPQDFVPRMHYGTYLESIWQDTQKRAAGRGDVHIRLVPSIAVAVRHTDDVFTLMTERGDAIALDRLVLATGNEVKPAAYAGEILQEPWMQGALTNAAQSAGPILLIGTGLTAVDVVLALRSEGYAAEIVAMSRKGVLPQPHQQVPVAEALCGDEIGALQTLQQWMAWLRSRARSATDWRSVVDGLRPFTQASWQRLRMRQQQIFFRRAYTLWNSHRHRMAPKIARQLAADSGLRVMSKRQWHAAGVTPALAINCTGGELDVTRSMRPLLRNLLAQGLIEPHANAIGIAVDAQHRAWGGAYPGLYAIGALMTGQLLESTAVPELRAQAKTIAEALCR